MLTGEFNHSIDPKGRLIIPSKFRDILGEEFVITKGLDGCLFLYPNNEWKIFEDKLRAFPLTNKDARALIRFFLAGAMVSLLIFALIPALRKLNRAKRKILKK